MTRRLALCVLSAALASGCAGMSGLDASSSLACDAPVGLSCVSVSQTYAIAKAGQLPSRAAPPPASPKPSTDSSAPRPSSGSSPPAPYHAAARPAPSVQYTTPGPIPTAASAVPGSFARTSPADMNAPSTGAPLRTPERVLRIWIAPFQDTEGDLHDQRYVYVTITPGQWTLEATRAAVRNQYPVVRPLSPREPVATPTSDSGAPSGVPPRSPTFAQPSGIQPSTPPQGQEQ